VNEVAGRGRRLDKTLFLHAAFSFKHVNVTGKVLNSVLRMAQKVVRQSVKCLLIHTLDRHSVQCET
jgi:hypothetical protein